MNGPGDTQPKGTLVKKIMVGDFLSDMPGPDTVGTRELSSIEFIEKPSKASRTCRASFCPAMKSIQSNVTLRDNGTRMADLVSNGTYYTTNMD